VIDQLAAHDRVQPSRELRARLEIRGIAHDCQPRFLQQIVGDRRYRALPQEVTVDGALVAVVQLAESTRIAGGIGCQQILVARRIAHSRPFCPRMSLRTADQRRLAPAWGD